MTRWSLCVTAIFVNILPKGGGLFKFPTPPLPPDPPKFSNPSFSKLSFWGKAEGAEKIFGLLTGYFFLLPYVYILKIPRIWWRIHKWVKNIHKKIDPRPDLRVGRWLMGA